MRVLLENIFVDLLILCSFGFLNKESKNNSCLNSPIDEKDASLNCMSQDDSKSANCNGPELDCVSMTEKNMEHLSAVERNLNCKIPRMKLQTTDLCKYEARSQRRCRIIKSEIFKSKKIKRARIKHSHIQEELKTVYKKSNLPGFLNKDSKNNSCLNSSIDEQNESLNCMSQDVLESANCNRPKLDCVNMNESFLNEESKNNSCLNSPINEKDASPNCMSQDDSKNANCNGPELDCVSMNESFLNEESKNNSCLNSPIGEKDASLNCMSQDDLKSANCNGSELDCVSMNESFLNEESKNNSCLNSPIGEKDASLNCMSQDDSKSANCNGSELDCVSMNESFLNEESKNNSCLNSPIGEKDASLNCMSQDDSKSANCNGPELDCVSMNESFLNEESKNNSCLNSSIDEQNESLNCMSQDVVESANCNRPKLDCVNMNETCLNNETVQDNISKNIHDTDPSYVPSNTSSDESYVQPVIDQATNSVTKETNNSANTSSGLEISMSLNVSGKCARDDTEMFVTSVGAGNKKHFCMYCKTFQSKIARHLERVHANELEVQKFKNIPKGTDERRKILETIRRRGDFYFNVDCAVNDGELLVERRSKKEYNRTPSDYVVCPKCKVVILKVTSRHHYRRCITIKSKDTRSISVLGRQVVGRIHNEASNDLRRRVFPILREDDIVKAIRYDELVIAFGNQQCEKYKTSEHNDAMIRQKMRRMGRLLLELKCKNSNITDFASIYFPRYSIACIEAINSLAGLSLCAKFYKTPSLASALGGLIKEMGKILINRCIRNEDGERKLRTEDFLKVFTEDFNTRVSKTISETMSRNLRRKKITLPSKADIIKLHNFLKQERETTYNSLEEKFSYDAWLSLTKATLISIQVFNRRRAGEIQRTLIEDYKTYQGINFQTNDMYKALSPRAKEIAKKYVRFTLRGKLGRTVPVLLTAELRDCIEMILKHRKAAKVSSKNPYLFGLPSLKKDNHKYLLACDLLRQYAVESGAENPDTLRGTQLRKHIATTCIHYNLSENEISTLANFMGHADKIHLSHYRQPVIEKEILEISQYLEAAQGVDMDESDSNDSDSGLSDIENTTKTTTKTYDGEINEGEPSGIFNKIASRKTIRNFQQDVDEDVDEPDTSSDISYLDDNMENDQNVVNVKRKMNQNRKLKDSQQRNKKSTHTWTPDEKRVVLDAFGHYIHSTDKKLPTFSEIGNLIQKHKDLLGHRKVPAIKTWVRNQKQKYKKGMKV